MSTLHMGAKTHQAVLPQRPALEPASADKGRGTTKRGAGTRPSREAGVQHGRGETVDASPSFSGVTAVRREAREGHPVVFVLDKHGQPLQPCHPARARKLLAKGRAVVHRHTPFVIRLKDRTVDESEILGVQIGIDPGSRQTGIAVFAERDGTRTGRFGLQLDHRGWRICEKLAARSNHRRGRRSRNLRYRAPRFHNRARPKGWLAPSLRHRVDTALSWVGRLYRWTPVRAIHLELAAFDTHALSAGRPLEAAEYRQGTLLGYEVREYLLTKWSRTCAYCGAQDVPLNLDHIRPRSRGGSDRVSNLALACVPCNVAKDNQPVDAFLAGKPELLARVLAQAKAPLRDAAAMNSTRWALWSELTATGLPVHVGSGGRTRWNRHRTDAPKSHTLDALHVGLLDDVASWPARVLVVAATGRGVYARTIPDRYGFPRLRRPRIKTFHGFQTGDLARALVPKGKNAGTHVGRIAVRSRGSFSIRTHNGWTKDVNHRHFRLLQRSDGYGYTLRYEEPRAATAAK